tara:strand:- start:263 stop:445 length:183 start_codon:yes stop_codon:yes gene_type:complete
MIAQWENTITLKLNKMKEYEDSNWDKLKKELGKFIIEGICFAFCIGFFLSIFVVILKLLF